MNLREAKMLLVEASAIDNRVVSDIAVKAWAAILSDVPYKEASKALIVHRANSTEYVQPAHIVRIVKKRRFDERWDDTKRRPIAPAGKRYAVDVIEMGELE